MNIKEFEECISNISIKDISSKKEKRIKLSDKQIEKLYNYMCGILNWNEKVNVTSITNEKEFIIKHYIDSLAIVDYIKDNSKVLDVGTGAGFPGIPIAIFLENCQVNLIDSVRKKLTVIEDLSKKIELKNISLVHTRAEDFGKAINERESYDIVTSRAVSNMSTLVEYLLPLVKLQGKAICMKGPNFEKELEKSKNAIKILGGTIEKVDSFLINNEIERNIIVIKKIKNIPSKYPRGKGLPLKEPIV